MNRRDQVVGAIGGYFEEKGYSPSVRDVATRCGMTVSCTHRWLRILKQEGKVIWEPRYSRTLTVIEEER